MLKRLRTVLVLMAITVFACGNALTAMADAGEHMDGLVVNLMGSHEHVHTPGHTHDATVEPEELHAAETCQGAACDSSEHYDHSYCHIHVHCCGVTGFLPAGLQVSDPAPRELSLARFADALPLGGLVYPLLRPPRRSV